MAETQNCLFSQTDIGFYEADSTRITTIAANRPIPIRLCSPKVQFPDAGCVAKPAETWATLQHVFDTQAFKQLSWRSSPALGQWVVAMFVASRCTKLRRDQQAMNVVAPNTDTACWSVVNRATSAGGCR